jgi:DNA-binding transcriptional LysR family regulator
MKIDPRHLELLAAIVDHGGMSEGATAFGRSQPSVSRTIADMETRLGAPLFEKHKRPFVPTELCQSLAAEGRRIAAAGNTASSIISSFKTGRLGIVRIGGTPVFMDGVIATLIAEFQTTNPQIRIEQSYGYARELKDKLEAGTLDVAICPMNPGAFAEGFQFVPVLPGRNVIACGTHHPLLRKGSLRLSDIAPYPWLAPPASSPLYEDMRHILRDIGVNDTRISFSGGTLVSMMTILSNSDALTVLPYSVVFMARRQRVLTALSIRIGHPERMLGILTRDDETARPTVRRFRSFLVSEFGNLSHFIQQHEQNTDWRD